MLAAAAILWITLDADAATPAARLGRGWTIGLEGRASFRPLFEYPDFQSGLSAAGGFQLTHAGWAGTAFTLRGDAGTSYVDDWRRVFETRAAWSWHERVEVRAGLRHDDRLRREGALRGFRDPTGRLFLGASALPFRKGAFAAGGALDYERALPGVDRLPSGISATLVGRIRVR